MLASIKVVLLLDQHVPYLSGLLLIPRRPGLAQGFFKLSEAFIPHVFDKGVRFLEHARVEDAWLVGEARVACVQFGLGGLQVKGTDDAYLEFRVLFSRPVC